MAATATSVGRNEEVPSPIAHRYLALLGRNRDQRQRREEDLADLRARAAAAADRGVSLRSLLTECLTAACSAWPESSETGKAGSRNSPSELSVATLQAFREATVALAEGHETAQRAAIRREEAMRREFVDDLLHGRADLGRLAERAERFGLRLVGPHRVAVARAETAFGAGDSATRYVEEGMATAFGVHDVLVTTKGGRLICVSHGSEADAAQHFATQVQRSGTEPHHVAISRPRPGPSGIVRSYHEACGTLDLAARLGLTTPVVHASELLVFQVLGRDQAAITDLVATVLGALERSRGGPGPLLETLAAYFECGCVNTTTARRLALSVRSVTYRITRIRQLTGYDPADPDQRYTLQTAVLGARLLGWPSRPLQPAD
ncbi:PucR family transcriptional regulator [Streptomyces albicerus]|uniref:PucR family transcriptional regulator n=1 Tax=Streptomyces albicerus TaxID=2569859 RepID=UPI00124B092E|nr:helix-turn-helix domain-containing protein [Streptomyces albicerus]